MFANTFAGCPIRRDASRLSAAVHAAWKSARERLSILVMAQLETLVETGPCADRNIARVRVWLYAVAALVFLMVSIGGATRLTGSGLSITEWQPIMGAVPPLSKPIGSEAFAKYRADPAVPARQPRHEPRSVQVHLLVGMDASLSRAG